MPGGLDRDDGGGGPAVASRACQWASGGAGWRVPRWRRERADDRSSHRDGPSPAQVAGAPVGWLARRRSRHRRRARIGHLATPGFGGAVRPLLLPPPTSPWMQSGCRWRVAPNACGRCAAGLPCCAGRRQGPNGSWPCTVGRARTGPTARAPRVGVRARAMWRATPWETTPPGAPAGRVVGRNVVARSTASDQPSSRRADCGWAFAWASTEMLACCRMLLRVSCAVS